MAVPALIHTSWALTSGAMWTAEKNALIFDHPHIDNKREGNVKCNNSFLCMCKYTLCLPGG